MPKVECTHFDLRRILLVRVFVLAVCALLVVEQVAGLNADTIHSATYGRYTKVVATPHVLFCTVSLRRHLVPMLRLAGEVQARGFRVSFASHDEAYSTVRAILPEARFISAGPLPGGGGPGPGGGLGDGDPLRWMSVDKELDALSRLDFQSEGILPESDMLSRVFSIFVNQALNICVGHVVSCS